jgi:hypothetical protein
MGIVCSSFKQFQHQDNAGYRLNADQMETFLRLAEDTGIAWP